MDEEREQYEAAKLRLRERIKVELLAADVPMSKLVGPSPHRNSDGFVIVTASATGSQVVFWNVARFIERTPEQIECERRSGNKRIADALIAAGMQPSRYRDTGAPVFELPRQDA